MIPVLALLAAAAPSISPVPAVPAMALPPLDPAITPYRAESTHRPRWGLDLADGTLVFREHSNILTIQVPKPQIRYDGFHVEAEGTFGGFTLDARHGYCRDWYGAAFPDVVTIRFNRTTLHGCGGTNRPTGQSDALEGTRWRLRTIDRQKIGREADVTLDFSRGRVLGRDGCNAFGATYAVTPGHLKFNEAIATEIACRPGEAALEKALWAQLGQEMAFTATPRRLLIRTADGHLSEFRRQDPLHFERTKRWNRRPPRS